MGKFILGVILTDAVLVLAGLGIATLGFFPTEANTAPPRLEQRVAQAALDASMKRHAPQLTNPLPPSDQNLIDGMKIYYVNCALCHGGLDRKPAALARNFYPPAPKLISEASSVVQVSIEPAGNPAGSASPFRIASASNTLLPPCGVPVMLIADSPLIIC